MRYCGMCGTYIADGAVFCEACGALRGGIEVSPRHQDLAAFGQRFAALLIDGAILFGALIVLSFLDAIGGILWLVGLPLYFIHHEGSPSGQTIGKRVLGIRVVRANGGPLGNGLAVGRTFARVLSQALFGLGYWWMLWDDRKQTFHDKLAGTFVVKVDAGTDGVTSWPG